MLYFNVHHHVNVLNRHDMFLKCSNSLNPGGAQWLVEASPAEAVVLSHVTAF